MHTAPARRRHFLLTGPGWPYPLVPLIPVAVTIVLAVLIANQVTQEGASTWFEGLQLLGVYVVLGIVFFAV